MTAYPRLAAALKKTTATTLKRGLRDNLARALAGTALACALCALPCQALAINDDAVLKRMDTVLEENARLREEAWKARKQGHEAAKRADEAADASDERVERARTEALAHVAGVSTTQVEGLRKEGRSWGQAAGDLGVHPGFLGVGKAPLYEPHSKAQQQPKVKRVKKGKGSAPAAVQAKSVTKKAKGGAKEQAKAPAQKQTKPQAKATKKVKKSKHKD